jgi:FKBP-type peptidyl-prolyl cis-trans isomerase FkpA
MMKKAIVLIMGMLLLSCNQGGKDPSQTKLSTEDDKTFYAMGFMLGSNLQRLGLSDKELSSLYKGLVTSAKGEKSEVEMQIYQPKIQTMFKDRMKKVADKAKAGGQKFLEDFLKKNKDAKKTKSGLVYQVIKAGEGAKPKETDTVEVHYHGTLTSGEVFDSSVDRGKKITFPLNRVIKGWTEGLQLISAGGKIKLIIPPELGYGDAGAPPKIPGGSTLVFEVELFQINPKAEAPKAAPKKAAPKAKK